MQCTERVVRWRVWQLCHEITLWPQATTSGNDENDLVTIMDLPLPPKKKEKRWPWVWGMWQHDNNKTPVTWHMMSHEPLKKKKEERDQICKDDLVLLMVECAPPWAWHSLTRKCNAQRRNIATHKEERNRWICRALTPPLCARVIPQLGSEEGRAGTLSGRLM